MTRADVAARVQHEIDAWASAVEATIPDVLVLADSVDSALDECIAIMDEQREQDRPERDRERG